MRQDSRTPIARRDIGGFTIRLWCWYVEVVTVRGWPVVLAVWNDGNRRLIYRLGR
jgi:hypothetical protein